MGAGQAGWHVLLGDNGSGKSTLLRACALALLGPKNALGLRQSFSEWIRFEHAEARISLVVTQDGGKDSWAGQGATSYGDLRFGVKLSGGTVEPIDAKPSPNRHVWGGGGWFSASFGPYRRFTGGKQEYEKLFYSTPKLASHLSIFGEEVALSETLTWLRELHYQQLDAEKRGVALPPTKRFLDRLKAFINQEGFLPNETKLDEIGPQGVIFRDPSGAAVEIVSLSDGFRSILSMTLELIRQLCVIYDTNDVFSNDGTTVRLPGVVLVDEIDVHLHPRWQRTIGPWLSDHFPNFQFIVTTHSPLVCQGATKGSITRLPDPGVDDRGGRVTGVALDRLLYGDILDAIGSGAFGTGIERSEAAKRLLKELAQLNVKSRSSKLVEADESRRKQLSLLFEGVEGTDEADRA